MNKVVKKIAAVALSGLLVASVFAGCSGGSAKDTYTVGICQAMQHPALDKATEGFKKALTDKLATLGIRVRTLSSYYHDQSEDLHCLVINYSGLKEERLAAALAAISQEWT